MPVTKTARRALRSSNKKLEINKAFAARLEIAIREAKLEKTTDTVKKAISLTDRAVKKNLIHKNKAARIKSKLSKLVKSQKGKSKKS